MRNNIFKEEINKLKDIDIKFNNLFNNNDFLDYDDVLNTMNKLFLKKIKFSLKCFFNYFDYRKYNSLYNNQLNKFNNYRNFIDNHNDIVLKNEILNFDNVCGLIEGFKLDDQQINAIVRKNRNQLVIASAGSGKTTTIIGKVKYLLKTKECNAEDILLLSFTNSSANEMKERIEKETGVSLDVMTFHKLGLEIIKKSIGQNVKIYDKNLHKFIESNILECIKDSSYLKKLIYFISTARFESKDEFDFTNENEYDEYLQSNKPTTINGEVVKSYGELEIANYLFENNIKYIYENEYKENVMDMEHSQYKPDFYLPDYDLYIEYFGIDENNKVAPYFKGKNGKSASEIYNESIKWKRNTHKRFNTVLIETFYYEKKHNKLIENLHIKLKEYGVKFEPLSYDELWDIINKNNNGLIHEICRAFETVINLIKSNNYSLDYLYSLPEVKNSMVNIITLDLLKPIFESYQKELDNNGMIDFNDMINMATLLVIENKYVHNYKYVIVDEYQDISKSRFRLLKAMRDKCEYKLFCVGDDWQSIYRFNGSDISLITDFEKYWGKTYISFIEKTYRFTSMIASLSSNFIMRNTRQIKKNIDAKLSDDFALKFINGYTENKCIDFLEEKLCFLERNSTVFLLGRYSFDIDMFKNINKFTLRYNNIENVTEVIYSKRKDLKIRFITVHKSKGLQADYVVIINNKNRGMGFPSIVNDLLLIKLLLDNGTDEYPWAEERRLFYVALTRAKKQAILLTIDNNKSFFAQEIEKDFNKLLRSFSLGTF